MIYRSMIGAIGAVLMLNACTVLPEATPIDFYTLQPATVNSTDAVVFSQVRVGEPELSDALQLERIIRITQNGRIEAYSGARWSSPIAGLWQNWLLDALWRDSRFEHISSAQQGLAAQWQLTGRLQAFHIVTSADGTHAHVRFDAQLINIQRRELTASQRFQAMVAVNGDSTDSAVSALSAASQQVGDNLFNWLATVKPK